MSDSADLPGPAPDLPQKAGEAARPPARDAKGRFAGTGKAGGRPSAGRREKHGLGALRTLVVAGMARSARDNPIAVDEIDGRSRVGKAMRALRRALIDEQGGPDAITPQMSLLVDLIVTDQLMIGTLDTVMIQLAETGELIDEDKHGRITLAPLVRERAYLADCMARRLNLLGLERRARQPKSLQDHLRELAEQQTSPSAASDATVNADSRPAS